MDEQGFATFLKRAQRPKNIIKYYTNCMKAFEDFLVDHGKTLDEATPNDIRVFTDAGETKYRQATFISAVRNYYIFTGNDRMRYVHDELDLERPNPYKLTQHIGVDPQHVKSLAKLGIRTVRELLQAGKTQHDREKLAEQTAIPYEDILELVKLSDLSRMLGPKRARLYFDAGYDSFNKIATMDAEVFRTSIEAYISKTGMIFLHQPRARPLVQSEGQNTDLKLWNIREARRI